MAEITVFDCEQLYRKFVEYTQTAEQHEFVRLAIVNERLDITKQNGWNIPQKEKRAMFRTVLKVIGEDCSAYEEETNEE